MPPVALIGGTLCLSTLIGGCVALAALQRIAGRNVVVERLATISGPYLSSQRQDEQSGKRAPAQLALLRRVQRICGFNASRGARYGTPFNRLLLICCLIAAAATFCVWRMAGPIGLSALPVATIFLTRLYYRRSDASYAQKLFRQFPDALAMIVRAVRVGVPLSGGVALVAEEAQRPTCDEFRQLGEDIAIGRPLPDALKIMAARNQLPEYRFFATALAMQSQTGGGLAETLDTLADTIRRRVAARARGHALASEARTSCYVLGVLPFAVGGMLCLVDFDYISVLFRTAGGQKLLGAAAASLAAGLYLMKVISSRTLK